MICIRLLSSLKRWMQEPCSQSQNNEGVHSWPPGCYTEIHLVFFRFLIVQMVPALVYLHIADNTKLEGGGSWGGCGLGQYAAFRGLIMARGRLGETSEEASADRSPLDLITDIKHHCRNCFHADCNTQNIATLNSPSFWIYWILRGELERSEIRATKEWRQKRHIKKKDVATVWARHRPSGALCQCFRFAEVTHNTDCQ